MGTADFVPCGGHREEPVMPENIDHRRNLVFWPPNTAEIAHLKPHRGCEQLHHPPERPAEHGTLAVTADFTAFFPTHGSGQTFCHAPGFYKPAWRECGKNRQMRKYPYPADSIRSRTFRAGDMSGSNLLFPYNLSLPGAPFLLLNRPYSALLSKYSNQNFPPSPISDGGRPRSCRQILSMGRKTRLAASAF